MTDEVLSVHMPAGTYFVGDPCYAVPDERWMEFLRLADPDVFGENPTRTDGGVSRILNAELDGHPVLGIGTAYGDGEYEDQDGQTYPVDAGLIGLVDIGLAQASGTALGSVATFDRPFECSYKDGKIVLGHIVIDTDPEDDDSCYDCGESEYECRCYEEEDDDYDEDDE